jgi:ATP-dependent DNA helicase RecG
MNIIRLLEDGLQSPLFEELQEGFRVTVYMTTQKITQKTTTKDKMLELLHADPNMTRADLALQLSKSENTIKEHLATLKSAGRLKRVGSDKGGYWMVIIDGK